MRRCVFRNASGWPSAVQDEHDWAVAVAADKTILTDVVAIFSSDALHGVAVNACEHSRSGPATVETWTMVHG